jgi:16S rRNA processing protein RimM
MGEITGAQGIRGEAVVRTYTEDPDAIATYGPLTDEPGTRHFTLTVVRVTAKGTVVRIDGVSDRTAAEALKGTKLYVDRASLPQPDEGAYYHADLIGLAAVDTAGTPVGEVIAVLNYGAGDILEIRLKESAKTELIPFQNDFVPDVDIGQGRIVIRMPDFAPDEEDYTEE